MIELRTDFCYDNFGEIIRRDFMNRNKKILIYFIFIIFFLLISITNFSKKVDEKEKESYYEWAPIPSEEVIKQAIKTKSENGIVVIERNSEIKIGGILDWILGNPQTVKEEFVRYIIVDENGLKNAEADIETISLSKIEEVEARTVLPDGKIVIADKDKDIALVKFKKIKEKDVIFSAGKVKFPQPQVGAILDLHYKIYATGLVISWLEPLVYKKMPVLKLKMKFILTDKQIGWQVMAINTEKGDILKMNKTNEVEVNIENITAGKDEPYSPPSVYYQPYIFAFANLLGKGNIKYIPANWTGEILLDERGLPIINDIDKIPFKPFWQNLLNDYEEERKNFLKGKEFEFQIVDSTLLTIPPYERAKKITEFVQKNSKMLSTGRSLNNISEANKPTLSKSLKDGFAGFNEVAYFISYLFDKYNVSYEKGIIMNRNIMRFSPYIPNAYVFAPIYAFKLSYEGHDSVFVTGDINFPFGSLDSQYQNSIFLSLDKDSVLHCEMTPTNKNKADYKKIKFELTVNDEETMSGKVLLEESGSPSNELVGYLQNEKRKEIEKTKQKKKKEEEEKKEAEEKKDKIVKEELEIINDDMKIDEWKIVKLPENSLEPLQIEYKVSSKKSFEKMGDIFSISVIPLIEHYVQPFVDNKRELPIWFSDGMTTYYEGAIILPKGYTIEDIPKQQSFDGGENVNYTFSCEKGEFGDRKGLKINLQIIQPLMSKKKDYQLIKGFFSSLSSVAKSKAIVRKEGSNE